MDAPQKTQKTLPLFLATCRTCWPLILGNVLEWYEYSVYGYVGSQIKENFFHGSEMATWLGFGIIFAARPFGGFFFGWMADRFGRRSALLVSIYGMIIATVGQGLLPTYACCGNTAGTLGLVLFVILRFLQGICTGGEMETIISYMTEASPKSVLGLASSLCGITCGLGAFLASGVAAVMSSFASEAWMITFGWRVPFLIALIPGVVALWGRRGLKESEEFRVQLNSKESTSVPEPTVAQETASHAATQKQVETVGDGFSLGLLRYNACAIIVSFLSIAAPATVWFVGPMWIATFLQNQGLSPSAALWASNASQVVSIAVSLLGGLLTDIYGVGFVNFWAGIITMVFALPVFALISYFPTNVAVITVCLVFVYGSLQGIVDSTIYLYCAEMFPTSQRTRGLSLGYNMGMSIFGGAGPLISQASLGLSWLGPGIHMSASGLVTAVAVASGLLLQRWGKIQLTHLRDEPYFGKVPQARDVPEQSKRQSQGTEVTSAEDVSV